MLKQAVLLLLASSILGLGVNLFSPNKIPYVGVYRELSSGDGPVVPPTAEEGDPPFVDINTAQMEFANSKPLFVDAREEGEFRCGTIPGSVNIPFEYIPEDIEDLTPYLDSILQVGKEYPIITFCSGEECDLSLHLGRLLQDYGYTNVSIFFGGAREWENFELEMERREQCEE